MESFTNTNANTNWLSKSMQSTNWFSKLIANTDWLSKSVQSTNWFSKLKLIANIYPGLEKQYFDIIEGILIIASKLDFKKMFKLFLQRVNYLCCFFLSPILYSIVME